MEISKSKRKNKNQESNGVNLDSSTLRLLCRYSIADNAYVNMNHIVNLKNLIFSLDMDVYQNNIDKVNMINFVRQACIAKVNNNLKDPDVIMNFIESNIDFDSNTIDLKPLNSDDVKWCHNLVGQSAKYGFAYSSADTMLDICTRLKTTDFKHRGELLKEFENQINIIQNDFRKAEVDDNLTDMTFSLKEGSFDQAVVNTYNTVTNPSRKLVCGMQGLNNMVGGGFESGRVYMFMGITGVGKSVTLLNLLYQMKIYNSNYKSKDPNKTPAIVLLTMENTVVETITRLFDMVTNSQYGMEGYTIDEVLSKLRNEGQLFINNKSPIDIVIKYKANRSVDTSYLYSLYDDMDSRGYEMICLIQDHIKRIRSIDATNMGDVRLELGNIVNEFKVFAAAKDIPVITVSHLNRDAAKVIEDGQGKKIKTDVTTKLGKSNIGESFLMLDNLDMGMIVNLDYDQDQNKYMAFELIKKRVKTDFNYFAQPFAYGNSIRMVEDYNTSPMYKLTIHGNMNVPRVSNVRTDSSNVLANMNNVNNVIPIGGYQPNQNTNITNTFTPTMAEPEEEYYDSMDSDYNDLPSIEKPVDKRPENYYVSPIVDDPDVKKEIELIPAIYFIDKDESISEDDIADLKNSLQK